MTEAKQFQDLEEYGQLVRKSAASSDGTRSDEAAVDAALKSLDEDGFAIVENLLPPRLLEALRDEVFELVFGFWFVFKGIDFAQWEKHA